MAKLKQSLAVLRQIPEHIRTNYPLFVDFLRAYYEHLEQTQQQDLESIHDIDTVLDEFVFKFKDEIAKNFPVELLSNKRMVMKHLREFYLSRGSEDSYKFLFRVLFSKEASLFYPSTEMLRVSDGRWQQDVSIFVLSETGEPIVATGKYIYITNSRGKKIRTYCESTVEYNTQIYEVFITRDYINELNIGAAVALEDGTILGTIVPCPSKFNIYKAGSGFKVGDIFSLKTQIGRGCIVKVTKIGSLGEIKKLQVIKFGLDYETKFYSYLSSKTDIAYEYIHPLKLASGAQTTNAYDITVAGSVTHQINYIVSGGNPLVIVEIVRNDTLLYQHQFSYTTSTSGGLSYVTVNDLQVGDKLFITGITELASNPAPPIANPDDPTSPNYNNKNAPRTRYTEPTDGFVDYGWASKQTYFYYDTTIPVGDESYASDRFYAESGYVGEIVQQFYADTTNKPIDETLAIIEVELGAVAKYPGYFNTANGFISDEMFIQDGNYYQAFSYVIRVEEELRRYSDIVKALVHPAGMKLFSEYNIYNELKLSYVQPKAFLTLQLPLFGHSPSTGTPLDQGYAYADILDANGDVIENAYTVDISASGELTIVENINAAIVYSQQGKASLYNVKVIEDVYSGITDTVNTKYIEKLVAETITERMVSIWTDERGEGYGWNYIRNYDEEINKSISKTMLTLGSDDSYYPDSVTAIDISYGLDIDGNEVSSDPGKVAWMNFKSLTETILNSDTQVKDVSKLLLEYITERYTASATADINGIDSGWTIIRNYDEAISKSYEKNILIDEVILSDVGYSLDIDGNKVFSDIGKSSLQPNLIKVESLVAPDVIVKDTSLTKVESFAVPDAVSNEPNLIKVEAITDISDAYINEPNLIKVESLVAPDVIVKDTSLTKVESLTSIDAISNEPNLNKVDAIAAILDTCFNEPNLNKNDAIASILDTYYSEANLGRTELISILETILNDTNLGKAESITLSEIAVNDTNLSKAESISFADVVTMLRVTFIEETLTNLLDALYNEANLGKSDSVSSISDALYNAANLGKADSVSSISDALYNAANLGKADAIGSFVDAISFARSTLITDNSPALDSLSNEANLRKTDSITSISDILLNEANLGKADSINTSTNGRVRLNSYDSEQYYIFTEDYQNQTTAVVLIT